MPRRSIIRLWSSLAVSFTGGLGGSSLHAEERSSNTRREESLMGEPRLGKASRRHDNLLAGDRVAARLGVRPRLRLGEAVLIHRAHAQLVAAGLQIVQRHAPQAEAVARRPLL